MKATIIYYQYPLYDKGSYIQEQVNAICKEIDGVVLISSRYPKDAKFKKPKNLKIYWVPRFNIPFVYDIYFNFAIFLKAAFSKEFHNTKVINVVCARGVLAAIWLKIIFRKKLVCTIEIINDPEASFSDKLFFKAQKYLYSRKKFDKIICWSKYYFNKYLKNWGISETNITYITCGIDLNLFNYKKSGQKIRKKYLKNKNERLLVFAKPMWAYNRQSAKLLLESVSLLKDKNIKLLFGSGEQLDFLKADVKKLKMEDQIFYMKPVGLDQIPYYIAAADIVPLTFTYPATTARSFLEALAMKKPVIVTKTGEIPNIVTNGVEVLLVKKNKNDISKAVKELLENKKLADQISINGYNLVRYDYSIGAIAKQIKEVYCEVV